MATAAHFRSAPPLFISMSVRRGTSRPDALPVTAPRAPDALPVTAPRAPTLSPSRRPWSPCVNSRRMSEKRTFHPAHSGAPPFHVRFSDIPPRRCYLLQKRAMDPLVNRARDLLRAEDAGAYADAVAELHERPTKTVFDDCVALSSSPRHEDRRLSADVLGQLGYADGFPFRDATLPLLTQLLSDPEAAVVQAAVLAFGHLDADASAVASLAGHPDPNVRGAVAFALLGLESTLAIDTLIALSDDDASEVRDWATFGLGSQIDTDTPEILDALLARVEDPDPDTRAEAIAGLVTRHDSRAVDALIGALSSHTVGSLEVEAARDLGTPELALPLEQLRTWWDVDPLLLELAISRCKKPTDLKPFRLLEPEVDGGQWTLYLRSADSLDLHQVFQKANHRAGGYGWEAVASYLLEEHLEEAVARRIGLDCENDTFVARSADKNALRQLAELMVPLARDSALLAQLLQRTLDQE